MTVALASRENAAPRPATLGRCPTRDTGYSCHCSRTPQVPDASPLTRRGPPHARRRTADPCPARRSGNAYRAQRRGRGRSEEHTSELQSHSDLVCRLLLEKKKNNKKQ